MSLVTASEADIAQILNLLILLYRKMNWVYRIVVLRSVFTGAASGHKFFGTRHHRG